MTTTSIVTRTVLTLATAAIALGSLAACAPTTDASSDQAQTEQAGAEQAQGAATPASETPSNVLSSTAWETTSATDQDGKNVALDDEDVSNFVGWAYFKADGTFTMYTLDDSPKMQGDWTVDAEGRTRHIVAKDDSGKELFQRDSTIITLTGDEFTYRVFPDEKDTTTYFDIIHTPTDHAEPMR